MLNKFNWTYFSDCCIDDKFFDSLKSDYEEFPIWFDRKSTEGARAFVYKENDIIKAFIYLKQEDINYATLKENGLFETHPYKNKLSKSQFEQVLKMGGKNVHNIIID